MKKKILVIALAVAMLALPFSAVFAKSPMIEVSGTITSGGIPTIVKEVGQNRFMFVTTASTWDGDISGSTTGTQTWIIHFAGDPVPAHLNINVELFLPAATVNGKTGSMTIELNMIAHPADPSANHGTWRIKDAAGELEGLHGGGAWLSVPNRYEGKVHFSK